MKITLHSISAESGKLIPVAVTLEASKGIGLHLVGLDNQSTKEILLRVTTAIMKIGQSIPGGKIIINISPNLSSRCPSSQLDLPVALSLLALAGKIDADKLDGMLIAGELRLNGETADCSCIDIPQMSAIAQSLGLKGLVVPHKNLEEDADRIPVLQARYLGHNM